MGADVVGAEIKWNNGSKIASVMRSALARLNKARSGKVGQLKLQPLNIGDGIAASALPRKRQVTPVSYLSSLRRNIIDREKKQSAIRLLR
jgi:hypothetical protein